MSNAACYRTFYLKREGLGEMSATVAGQLEANLVRYLEEKKQNKKYKATRSQ